MRNIIGPKKVKKMVEAHGLPIVSAMTRGGTRHRIDMCLVDGHIVSAWPDGYVMFDADDKWRSGIIPYHGGL